MNNENQSVQNEPGAVGESHKGVPVETAIGGEVDLGKGSARPEARRAGKSPCLAIPSIVPLGFDDMCHEFVMGERLVMGGLDDGFERTLHAVQLEGVHLLERRDVVHR